MEGNDILKSRLESSKAAVQNMLFYYITTLIDCGVKDPKQKIATEIGEMIDMSEEQAMFVQSNISLDSNILKGLSSSIDLLKNMERAGKIDQESIGIVINLLTAIKDSCEKWKDGEDDG